MLNNTEVNMEQEEWKPVIGWEDRYEVSNEGRIRSLCHRGVPRKHPMMIAVTCDDRGYGRVALMRDRVGKRQLIHRLVLEAFVGPCPEDKECGHLDGNPYNNVLSNLAWVSKKENMRHRDEHGTTSRGENRPLAVFTEEEVRTLRALHKLGYKRNDLVKLAIKKTKCNPTVIRNILGNRTWKHVTT